MILRKVNKRSRVRHRKCHLQMVETEHGTKAQDRSPQDLPFTHDLGHVLWDPRGCWFLHLQKQFGFMMMTMWWEWARSEFSKLSTRLTLGETDSWALLSDILIQVQEEALESVHVFFKVSQVTKMITSFKNHCTKWFIRFLQGAFEKDTWYVFKNV